MLVLKSNDFYAHCDAGGCTQCFDTDARDEAKARRVLAQHGWRVVDGPTAATFCIEHRDFFKRQDPVAKRLQETPVSDEVHAAVAAAVGEHFPKWGAETVNHPAHYGGVDDPYEAIKVIEAWRLDFNLGNAVKYVCRAGKKGDALEDLKKSRWYLDRAIANLEKKMKKRVGECCVDSGQIMIVDPAYVREGGTGVGDGRFPVYAEVDDKGQILAFEIRFDE
jgi:hypothetical protein